MTSHSWQPARPHGLRANLFVACALTVSASLVLLAQARPAQPPPRPRAPDTFACNRNDLTAYIGTVVAYQRRNGQTTLMIRTDWDTTESTTLRHPGSDDPSAFFRIEGKPFTAADWPRIERAKGVLREGTRAAVWVCADGKTMVDWLAPRE